MNKVVGEIKEYLKEYSYLKSIYALHHWDMETMMPAAAIGDRADRLSYIQGKLHAHITAKKYGGLLKTLGQQTLKPRERKLLKELRFDYEITKASPLKHVLELSHAQTMASHAWADARRKNDWKSFRPHLQKLIDLKRREAGFFDVVKPYDALIRLHDKEFDSAAIGSLFQDLKTDLLTLTAEVNARRTFVKVKDLKGPFPIEAQKKLSAYVTGLCGLPATHSRLDESTHPFSINISPHDQRITTRYTTENLDSLSSTMHEVGHALYELNLPRAWEGTPFAEAVSLSVHESQSRFWENVIGRSREFCQLIHPKMRELFGKSMNGVDEETLFHVFNKSVPGLIRVESSELYYNLHVIIRFEVEELIFNQGMDAAEIPAVWDEKYRTYLGISSKDHTQGVLQDSHWAGGAFGYFPTYSLGNLISGSLQQKVKRELPGFSKAISQGNLAPVLEYLKNTIHNKGRSVSSRDLVGKLGTRDYVKYLKEKFAGE
ncbi:MAG TPA: carboxypeptidase M32 [Bacteriovoracaceae bacterium]|nr:carboxypeptidase M32 [Bacteriovoracaceae bacterium]